MAEKNGCLILSKAENVIKIICVCGARPNFMKIAFLMRAFKENGGLQTLLVHTGQHYDDLKSDVLSFISNSL